MTYQEALEKSLNVRWKTKTCPSGPDCWCRLIVPEEEIVDSDGNDVYIAGSASLHYLHAEHIVQIHNESLNLKSSILSLQDLKDMEPFTVFAHGVTHDPRLYKDPVRWLAKRGRIHDWAIYYHLEEKSLQFIEQSGDKSFTPEVIRELVPCDDEAFKMYRF
jgi:hypothetical protein